jgi:hypothetical protein
MTPELGRGAVHAISLESRGRTAARGRMLAALTTAVAMALLLLIAYSGPVRSQVVKLVTVDVNVVTQGYRASKLMGSTVTNDKNERIGTLDDLVIGHDRSLFAVLQVGGFLGMGAHLVAIPYQSLVINEDGRTIQLPGASKDELKKLPEIKFRS